MPKIIQAYHFVSDTLRDGSPIPANGVKLRYKGSIELCSRGYHASRRAFDALQYAPGPILCLVECAGSIIEAPDKLVCSERTIIARFNSDDVCRSFARQQALSVAHLWDMPRQVREYLETGNEACRDAARTAAWDAAKAAAGAAARTAARTAAWAAAGAAAWDAARAAAWAAAGAAAGAAARAAAWDAAWAAAVDAFQRLVEQEFHKLT